MQARLGRLQSNTRMGTTRGPWGAALAVALMVAVLRGPTCAAQAPPPPWTDPVVDAPTNEGLGPPQRLNIFGRTGYYALAKQPVAGTVVRWTLSAVQAGCNGPASSRRGSAPLPPPAAHLPPPPPRRCSYTAAAARRVLSSLTTQSTAPSARVRRQAACCHWCHQSPCRRQPRARPTASLTTCDPPTRVHTHTCAHTHSPTTAPPPPHRPARARGTGQAGACPWIRRAGAGSRRRRQPLLELLHQKRPPGRPPAGEPRPPAPLPPAPCWPA